MVRCNCQVLSLGNTTHPQAVQLETPSYGHAARGNTTNEMFVYFFNILLEQRISIMRLFRFIS